MFTSMINKHTDLSFNLLRSQTLTFQKSLGYLLDLKSCENDEKCFLFHLKSFFCSQNI